MQVTQPTTTELRITEAEYLADSKRYFELAKSRPVKVTSPDGKSSMTLTIPQKPLDD